MSDGAVGPREPKREKPVRVIIADDHPVIRIGIRNVLSVDGRFAVIGEAGSGTEAFAQTRTLLPDVLLLDIQMPQSNGFDTLRQVTTTFPQTRVVLLTGSILPEQLAEAFNSGSRGVILKSALAEQILSALTAVTEGAFWAHGRRVELLAGVLADVRTQARQESTERFHLTRRELEVVGLIVKGYSNRDIAKHFHLSEETVKRHLSNTFDKLKISTRLELAIFALANKLVSPQEDR